MTVNTPPSEPLTFEVEATGSQAVITIRGGVDPTRAHEFEEKLDTVLAHGYRSIVLDVEEMTFINGSGLQAILDCAGRCDLMGGTLTVRSPPPVLRRLLKVAGIRTLIRVEDTETMSGHLGPEETDEGLEVSMRMPSMEPSQDERRIMELPANHEVVDGALRLIVALARETVGAADGVSVSLRRNGVLSTVAASDRTISSMDADQYATGEGPCVDASIQGRWYHAESMSAETRWPDFTPRALELGINSILSTPLMAQANPVGALNIYSRTELAFSPADQEMAALFADQASEILTNAGAQVTDDESAARFAEALSSRETIAQAQGILMERMGVSMTAAFSMLLHSSVVSRETLREEAEAVVRSVLRIWPDNTGSPHDRHDQ